MSNWNKIPLTHRITEHEYRANVEGINIVFGAVLGFVLVGGEGLPLIDFVGLLLISATVVVLILYLGSSEYKLFYGVLVAVSIAAFPFISEDLFSLAKVPKLHPTLAVWAMMIVFVELTPRIKTTERSNQENLG